MEVAVTRIRPGWFLAVVLLAGCASNIGRPGTPDPDPEAWRGFVGCYQVDDGFSALDTVPETELFADQPGVRLARFAPPALQRAYWFVDDRGVLWVYRHDGLWGTGYELRTVKGNTLTGWRWVRNDVPRDDPPSPATVIRTQTCPLEAPAG
jgi:hypothetical protein